ncbi:MAG: ferritin-like protein, partial [Gemmatimonadaceae bacterium]
TIPPYLCALYSIPEGVNTEAAEIVKSVVMEEMLHMTLVANVMNAVGGAPVVADPHFVADYPTALPHSAGEFKVSLLPLGPKALDVFLLIERPDEGPPQSDHYQTIGQFYTAIRDGIEKLDADMGKRGEKLFIGPADRQVPTTWYYGGGGAVRPVCCLKTAQAALLEVVEQGEGAHHGLYDDDNKYGQTAEVAHYYRFMEILKQRRYGPKDTPQSGPSGQELPMDWSAIYPMHPNPKVKDYEKQPSVQRMMVQFNRSYTTLLRELQLAFNGTPERLMQAVPLMYELRHQGTSLMKIPSCHGDGTTVGPSFEYDEGAPMP